MFSDLHLEHAPWIPERMDVDVAVCVGDVCNLEGNPHPSLELMASIEGPAFKLFVPGNHEFAGRHYENALRAMRLGAAERGIILLHEDEITIGGFRFLGTPLLTAMCDLPGRRRQAAWNTHMAHRREFSGRNTCQAGLWSPAWMSARRRLAARWLETALASGAREDTVVCTHWAPSAHCLSADFQGIDTSSYYHGNAHHLLEQAKWWLHGHVHHRVDMDILGCRVLCHPRGREGHPYRARVIDLAKDRRLRA